MSFLAVTHQHFILFTWYCRRVLIVTVKTDHSQTYQSFTLSSHVTWIDLHLAIRCITVHSILYVFYAVCVDMHTATCCHWIVSHAGIMHPSFPQALSLCKAPAAVFRHLDLSGGVGQFWGFSPRRNNVLQWWRWNLAWVLRAKFHHQSVQWWRWVPKNWKNLTKFCNINACTGTSFARFFLNFHRLWGAFCWVMLKFGEVKGFQNYGGFNMRESGYPRSWTF